MRPVDVVLVVAVLVVLAVAVRRFVGTVLGTRDCCSGGKKDTGPVRRGPVAEVEVRDTDPTHYPYVARLGVGGMTCERCVANVTAALDAMGGTWATAELSGGQALLRSKRPIEEARVREALEAAGYRLVSLGQGASQGKAGDLRRTGAGPTSPAA